MLPAVVASAQETPADTAAGAMVQEPGEEQIRAAYAAALEGINARSVAELGAADAAPLSMVLEDITKLGCRELDRERVQYDCRVERRIRRGERKPTTDVVQLWLSYEDEQWVAR